MESVCFPGCWSVSLSAEIGQSIFSVGREANSHLFIPNGAQRATVMQDTLAFTSNFTTKNEKNNPIPTNRIL